MAFAHTDLAHTGPETRSQGFTHKAYWILSKESLVNGLCCAAQRG